jgi:hypothetical protein
VKGAVCGNLVSEEAFYTLMRPGPGLFRIEYRESTVPESISKPNTYIMIEALRRLDDDVVPLGQVPPAKLEAPIRESSTPPPPQSEMRRVAPGSDPSTKPIRQHFANLADDLTLEEKAPAKVGSDLANALDRLIQQHLEDTPTEVVKIAKAKAPVDPKKLARVPLRRVSSPTKSDPEPLDPKDLIDFSERD